MQTAKYLLLELVLLPLTAILFHDGGALPNKIWVNLVQGRAPEITITILLNETYFEMHTALKCKQGMEQLLLGVSKIWHLHLWDTRTFGFVLNVVLFPSLIIWNCWYYCRE